MAETEKKLDIDTIVREALSGLTRKLSEERMEKLADSIISELELDGVIGEEAEARNLETMRDDLQKDPEIMVIQLGPGENAEALERMLFDL